MKPSVLALIVVVILVAVGGLLFIGAEDSSSNSVVDRTATNQVATTDAKANESDPVPVETESTITEAEVANHNTVDDCWTIIDGAVYDITPYVPRHPGGEAAISLACGTDGSSLFNERTTQDGEKVGSGTSHSSNAATQLASLKLGLLAN